MIRLTRFISILLIFLCLGTLATCGEPSQANHSPDAKKPKRLMVDKPLQAFQIPLLEMAYDTASTIPLHPHIKDRALVQYQIVTTCLEMGLPNRALGYGQKIDNWRRGAALADLARYCVENGIEADVESYLTKAIDAVKDVEDHRRDQVRVKVAMTRTLLGEHNKASSLEKGVEVSEQGKSIVARIQSDMAAYEAQVRELDALITTRNFDLVLNAARGYAALFDKHYQDAKRRQHAEDRIKASWAPLTILIRVELLMQLAEVAFDHNDTGKAKSLVDDAQIVADSHRWPLEYHIPLMSRLASLRHRAGDVERAVADADKAFEKYKTERSSLFDIDRASALRPLAEAYHKMGHREKAMTVYRLVVEDGAENPNARPRAIDLAATCRSMALCEFEPDTKLMDRMAKIRSGLGVPW